jgi:polyisoprenoid-binding protein YceI
MVSLKILDITDLDFEAKLRDEFFEAKKYATSTFSIIRVDTTISGTMVYGDLMIKGINQAINFPATVVSGPTGIQFKATFSIDRTLWNLTMREGMVNKFIEFNFDLFLTK